MLAKIGPGAKTIWRRPVAGSSWIKSVPVMSDGIRSGVNWIRENFSSSTRASVCTSSVFASPGTPTIRLLPPTNSVSSTSETTSSWPTIALRSSPMIRSRPDFIRSASATSSGDSRLMVVVVGCNRASMGGIRRPVCRMRCTGCANRTDSAARTPHRESMRHRIDDVVHAELVRLVREIHRRVAGVGPLPVLADVVVHVGDRDQPFLRVVVLEDAPVRRRQPAVGRRERQRIVDLEERMEGGGTAVQLHPVPLGQHAPHLRLQVLPIVAAKVVEDDEAAL